MPGPTALATGDPVEELLARREGDFFWVELLDGKEDPTSPERLAVSINLEATLHEMTVAEAREFHAALGEVLTHVSDA